jgi:hypothetical protein
MIADGSENHHPTPPPPAGTPPPCMPGPSQDRCPACGRPLTPPFDPTTSGVLDWLVRIDEDIRHLKAEVEEVLP